MRKVRCRKKVTAIFAYSWFLASPCFATDLLIKQSLIASTLETDLSKDPFVISGYAPSVTAQKDVSRNLSVGLGMDPLLNLRRQEISRFSVSGILNWSLLGQTRRYTTGQGSTSMTNFGNNSLYTTLRISHSNYQTYIDESQKVIRGSNVQILGGFGYRYDVNENNSVGAEGLITALCFLNSAEKVRAREYQLGLYWQFGI